MKRTKKHARDRKPARVEPAESVAHPVPNLTARRRFWFRVAALVGVPLCLLLLSEAGLRVAGYGYRTSFFKPLEIDGRRMLVENDKFGWRFFPRNVARAPAPVVLPVLKEPGTFRIFVFGESAALGDPRPAYGFSRYLEVLLRERYPATRFEVVNVAMTAISSHVIREIARECATLEGDLWILYAGNNEYYGPFGAGTVFGAAAPPLPLVRAQLTLQRTRVGQLLAEIVGNLRGRGDTGASDWTGLRMFIGHELAPSDPRRTAVQRNFARNVAAILDEGTRSGAKVLFVDMAVNLRDCPPFASSDSPGMSASDREEWAKLYASAEALLDTGIRQGVVPVLNVAMKENPEHAEACFQLAEAQLTAGDAPTAAGLFAQARDLDALPFRADSGLNAVARAMAEDRAPHGVTALDPAPALAQGTKAGVPGRETFYEHVHLTFNGNYRLARTVAERLPPLLPTTITRTNEAAADWASQATCEQRLGLTDWNRSEVIEGMVARLLDAPYTNQLHAAERVQRLWSELNHLRERMDPISELEAASVYETAIQQNPGDHRLYENQAEFRELTGDLAGAAADWEQVEKLLPHHFSGWYHRGRLLRRLGQAEESRRSLEKSLSLRPDLAEAHLELASLDITANRLDDALEECHTAREQRPNEARPLVLQADVLARLQRRDEALDSLREAIRVQPSDWEAHYLLGVEMAVEQKLPEAQALFAEAVRLKPGHVLSHLNLGIALAKQAKLNEALTQFQEVLRLDPVNQKALEAVKTIDALRMRAQPPRDTP